MHKVNSLIGNGQWEAANGRGMDLIDPTTGKNLAAPSRAGAQDVDAACQAAAHPFSAWHYETPAERSLLLVQNANVIECREDELVQLQSENTAVQVGSWWRAGPHTASAALSPTSAPRAGQVIVDSRTPAIALYRGSPCGSSA